MNERDAIQKNFAENEPLLQASEEGEFAQAVGAKLAAPVACPDAAWKTAMQQVGLVQQRERRMVVGRRAAMLALASAAVFLLVAGGYLHSRKTEAARPLFLTLDEHTIAGLEAKAEVSGGASVRALLRNLSLPVALDPKDTLAGKGSAYRLIGARKEQFNQDQAVELLFEHMGKPAILVIAPRTGGIAKAMNQKYEGSNGIFATRAFGDILVAAVGTKTGDTGHTLDDLLVLVGDPEPAKEPAASVEAGLSTNSLDELSAESSSMREGIVGSEEPVQETPPADLAPITPESESVPKAPVDTTIPEEVKQII